MAGGFAMSASELDIQSGDPWIVIWFSGSCTRWLGDMVLSSACAFLAFSRGLGLFVVIFLIALHMHHGIHPLGSGSASRGIRFSFTLASTLHCIWGTAFYTFEVGEKGGGESKNGQECQGLSVEEATKACGRRRCFL